MKFGTLLKRLNEQEDLLDKINSVLEELSPEEIDTFGEVIYQEFFEEDEEGFDGFSIDDVKEMINSLGATVYEDILDLLGEIEDDSDEDDSDEDDSDEIKEDVGRIMKGANKNRKKRKFMKNSKADMRQTKAARKKDARANKASRRRYYRANKAKIAAYQKSRSAAIKKGAHKVKMRRSA